MNMKKEIALPKEIKVKDLKYPSWKSKVKHLYESDFEMWYTERFGWCIPTLFISRARRGSNMQDRTYGVPINDPSSTITMGKGPHVLRTIQVYVTSANLSRLQKFVDIKVKGQGNAGQIRDNISTRRANTMARRRPLYGLGGFGF